MSDLNATPEVSNGSFGYVPAEAPPSNVPVEVPIVEAPVVEAPQLESTLQAEIPNAAPAAPVSAAASVPAEPVDQVSALSGEVAQTVHDLFTHIHEGFDQHSMMIGIARFYEIAKAVRARLES